MVGDERQGWAVLAAMTLMFVALAWATLSFEQQGNPRIAALGVDQLAGPLQSGGNMEGKETRFGIADSALFATITTAASCGAVNAMHDSFTPLGGLIPLANMQLGEVVFGGVGTGLYGMLVFAILAVFIAGLMIGRTPEYLGKKIEAYEMKMSSIAILVTPLLVLLGTAIAVMSEAGRAGIAGRAGLAGERRAHRAVVALLARGADRTFAGRKADGTAQQPPEDPRRSESHGSPWGRRFLSHERIPRDGS